MMVFQRLARACAGMAITVLATMMLAGAAEKAERHEFLEGSYSLVAPGDWWAEMDKDLMLTIAPTEESPTRLMVLAPDPEPGVPNSLEYAKLIVTGMFEAGKDGKVISEEKCKLGGRDAYLVIYSITLNDVEFIGGVYCMVSEGYGFAITALATKEQSEKFMPVVGEVADTFEISQENLAKIRAKLLTHKKK